MCFSLRFIYTYYPDAASLFLLMKKGTIILRHLVIVVLRQNLMLKTYNYFPQTIPGILTYQPQQLTLTIRRSLPALQRIPSKLISGVAHGMARLSGYLT